MYKQENYMKRTKILILCAMAAMATCAAQSSSASATKNPKWALCEARTAGTGQWDNSLCTTLGGEKYARNQITAYGKRNQSNHGGSEWNAEDSRWNNGS